MSLRLACIGDFHLNGLLFDSKIELLKRVVACKDYDILFFLGDIFHKSKAGDQYVSTPNMVDALQDVLAGERPVVMIEGNHDQFGTRGSGLDLLHMNNLLKIKDEPLWLGFGDTEIVCLPWIRNNLKYKEFVRSFLNYYEPTRKHRLLVGHFGICGSGTKTHFVGEDEYYSFQLPELRDTLFSPTCILAGHIHSRQTLENLAYYTGGFTQNNFGEQGNPQGYLIWEDGRVEYVDFPDAPRFYNCSEEWYEGHANDRDFFKFPTDNPHLYHGLRNVNTIRFGQSNGQEEIAPTENYTNEIDLRKLVLDYCEHSGNPLPDTCFVREELKKLEGTICRSQTGFSRLNYIRLKNIGPKGLVVHKDIEFSPKDGLIAVTGMNGKGKTLLLESLMAGLYGTYVSRGALKAYMNHPDSRLDLGFSAQGEDHVLSTFIGNKAGALVSEFDSHECELRKHLDSLVQPIVGDAQTFHSVVFLDQEGKKDLACGTEAERLSVLRTLLNLDFLEDLRKDYRKQLEDAQGKLAKRKSAEQALAAEQERLSRFEHQLSSVEPVDVLVLTETRQQLQFLKENQALVGKYRQWLTQREIVREGRAFLEGKKPEAVAEKKSQIQALQTEIQRQRKILSGDGIGCKPDFLPCSLLMNATSRSLAEKEQELQALGEWTQEDEEVLATLYSVNTASAWIRANYSAKFQDMKEEDTSISLVQEKVRVLEDRRNNLLFLEKEITNCKNTITKLEKQVQADHGIEELIQDLVFLSGLCDKKGLSLYIINSITTELQSILDELCRLCGRGLELRVSLCKKEALDTFALEFSDNGSPWAPIVPAASGGQKNLLKAIFKLGLTLYLNRFFGSYKVLILDEPEKGLDVRSTEALLTLLEALKLKFKQIIVVTHSDVISQIADEEFRVE